MSTQYTPSRTIPIRYSGYRTCDACHHQFYQEQPGQTTCTLCRVEQAIKAARKKPVIRPDNYFTPRQCELCGEMYTPRSPTTRYCDTNGCQQRIRRQYHAAYQREQRRRKAGKA